MKKAAKVFLTVFSYGVLICLFAGALALVGYLAALCIGGDGAASLCAFIYKTYFPWVIRAAAVAVGFGLIGMYLNREKALTAKSENIAEAKPEN